MIREEIILFVLILLLFILVVLYPHNIKDYYSDVDWGTIKALAGLLIITTGLKESGYFELFSRRILKRLKSERKLSIFLIFLSVILSTFLTNDVTLFVVVPLTLSIQKVIKNDISRLIAFEAISVNAGSSLTPIGNPQNLFLWSNWGISFTTFVLKMLPLFALLLFVLLIFAFIFLPDREINFSNKDYEKSENRTLFNLSLIFLIFYIISLEIKQVDISLIFIFMAYLVFYRKVLLKTDWLLIFLFIIIFIDFGIISKMHVVSSAINSFNLNFSANIFLISSLLSQAISNVPASVLITKFSHDWMAISYGVNIGGNGLAIASLANLIAIRMMKNKKIWNTFHKYSIPYFLITFLCAYLLFFVL